MGFGLGLDCCFCSYAAAGAADSVPRAAATSASRLWLR